MMPRVPNADAYAALCSVPPEHQEREGQSLEIVKLYVKGTAGYQLETVRTLARQNSPRVVHVREVKFNPDDSDELFEVMEFLPGGTLRERLVPGQVWTDTDARALLLQLTDGLKIIQNPPVGGAHRDLKPENVFLRDASGPLDLAIGDFGLLALENDVFSKRLRRVEEIGTERYWSPGHFSSFANARDDWWALGLIMHEALLGRHWFDDAYEAGAQRADGAKVGRILSGNLVPPVTHDDLGWKELLENLLKFSPGERWGEREVRAWLAGNGPKPKRDRKADAPPPPTQPRPDSAEFNFVSYHDPRTLAAAMREHWEAGEAYVSSRPNLQKIISFARRRGDKELAVTIERLRDDFETSEVPITAARRLAAVTRALDPTAAPEFHQVPISPNELGRLALAAAEDDGVTQRILLRAMHDSDVLEELAQLAHPSADGLDAIHHHWAANYEIVTRLRESPEVPREVRVAVIESERRGADDYPLTPASQLLAQSLALTRASERSREKMRRDNLLTLADDDPVVANQPWFATLVRHSWEVFTDGVEPRDGQVAALSSILANMFYDEAAREERRIVRDLSSVEPDFPDTPGGRREDVDYAEPRLRVGEHPTIPRPARPQYNPAAIFGARTRPSARGAASQLFRVLAVVGAGIALLGLVRLFGFDAAHRVDLTAPERLAAATQQDWFGGIVDAWAGLYATWMRVPPIAAIDPLSALGAWVPLLLAAFLIALAVAGFRSVRPLPTQFKTAPPPRGYIASAVLLAIAAGVILIVLLPWTLALILPVVIAVIIPASYV